MTRRRDRADEMEQAIQRLRARLRGVARLIPGKRPAWIVIDLAGAYPARTPRRPLFGLPIPVELGLRQTSLEELRSDIDAIAATKWVRGVVLRIGALRVARLATAYAIRQAVAALRRAGKQTVALISTTIDLPSYYVASAAEKVVAPECAEVQLFGLSLTVIFLRDALARLGIRFEKLAIDEYKNAFDEVCRQTMSPAQREQYDALLDAQLAHWVQTVAESRGLAPEQVRAAVDEGITSATRARELGLIDRVAYEEEVIGAAHAPLAEVASVLAAPGTARSKRIAVVSVLGAIVPGTSRRSPTPIPVVGGLMTGSETAIRCLRAAEEDDTTAAIVLHVDSGGGSAVASDLIEREVHRIRKKKPIVSVMEGVAASGGYYVLCRSNLVLAAPTTITGSIGVLTGKLVLSDFFSRFGMNPERLHRGRYAMLHNSAAPFADHERALLERANREVYERFLARVAEGRRQDRDRVDQVGRGHVWSGVDALRHGLVDELGDVQTAIDRACDLAGVARGAPTWNVRAPVETLLPTTDDPTTVLRALAPLLREKTLLLLPASFTLG